MTKNLKNKPISHHETQKKKGIKQCPECGCMQFFEDAYKGETYCAKCGYVLEESKIDTSQEWRAGDDEQRIKRARTGAPITKTKHDKGLTTRIGSGRAEIQKVPLIKRELYGRINSWQQRSGESKDRNLSYALSELQRYVSYLGLPRTVHEEVAAKYEEAVDKGLVRGRSMESVVAALLYAVCRELQTPRTLEEIADTCGVERREIGRTYRYIARELKLRILPAGAQDYIPRFASMLGLSDKIQSHAIKILQDAKAKEVISGKGPTGVAAAALYIAAVLGGEKRTQREIADALGVTEVTIRNRFKELVESLNLEKEIEQKVKEIED